MSVQTPESAADMLQYCASNNVRANSYSLLLTCYSIARVTECPCKLLHAADMLLYRASNRMSVQTGIVFFTDTCIHSLQICCYYPCCFIFVNNLYLITDPSFVNFAPSNLKVSYCHRVCNS